MALVSLTSCPRSHSLEEPPPCFLPSPRPSHEGQVTGSSALLALSPSQLPRRTGLPCARANVRCAGSAPRTRAPAAVPAPAGPRAQGWLCRHRGEAALRCPRPGSRCTCAGRAHGRLALRGPSAVASGTWGTRRLEQTRIVAGGCGVGGCRAGKKGRRMPTSPGSPVKGRS